MAIIAISGGHLMRSVNVAELKNKLSKYLRFAKGGEEIVIRDRNLPVAKLVPFSPEEGSDEELLLVAAGKMRLPKSRLEVEKLIRIRTGKLAGRDGTQALLEDREQSL
jgi:prevent-host-death family protein